MENRLKKVNDGKRERSRKRGRTEKGKKVEEKREKLSGQRWREKHNNGEEQKGRLVNE